MPFQSFWYNREMTTPENPFDLGEEDTKDNLDTDYYDFTPLHESFHVLEAKISEAFLAPKNIQKVMAGIQGDKEMYKEFRRAEAWLVKSKITPTEEKAITVMITKMLQDEDKVQRIKLYTFYKKLGFV